jgi:hypothetical protein
MRRVTAPHLRDLLVGPDGDDSVASDSYGLSDRESLIDCDDLAVGENEVDAWPIPSNVERLLRPDHRSTRANEQCVCAAREKSPAVHAARPHHARVSRSMNDSK